MNITIPEPQNADRTWSQLSVDLRNRVRSWMDAFKKTPQIKPIGEYFKIIAEKTGSSPGTAKRNYYLLKSGKDWTIFIPDYKNPVIESDLPTKNKEFRQFLVKLVEGHQRNNDAAFRKIRRLWQQQAHIPGYETLPGWPTLPNGWSKRNLARILNEETDALRLRSIRLGVSSKTNPLLPQVFGTRVGLYPGAVYQLDDMWHDNFVTFGKNRTPARVIELGALDLFSACRIHWGAKPRLKNEGGQFENLNEKDTRFFVAGLLHDIGYSERGTMIMVEHGTAALREDIERILYDATGGKIRIDRQPIEGKQQALTRFWGGTEGGNFRAKAALESSHNLIHNDLAHLSLQTGKDRDHRPITTNKQLQYISRIIKSVTKANPANIDRLRLPALDFHSQFIPLINDYYNHGLNARTDHELEAWQELGHLITEYTTMPGSEMWLNHSQFLALPDASRAIIHANAQHDPCAWTNKRYLSPNEVWQPARRNLKKLPDYLIADLLTKDLAREEKVKGSHFRFSDTSIAASEVIYEARILTPDHTWRELRGGETYCVFANPFEPRWLFVYDSKMIYQGKAELVQRVNPINLDAYHNANPWEERVDIRSEALKKAAGHKHQRTAEIHEPTRIRHADRVAEVADMREYNDRIIRNEETDPAIRRQQTTQMTAAKRQEKTQRTVIDDTFQSLSDLREPPEEVLEF